MTFFNKLSDLAKNIGDAANDAIEAGKLNSKANSEKNLAEEELKKIGEFYYNRFVETGVADDEVLEFCIAAKAHFDATDESRAEIERIKKENEAKLQEAKAKTQDEGELPEKITCPGCGAQNDAGTKFCRECGCRLEAVSQPEKLSCPSCGTQVAQGVRFCPECGQKME